MVRDIKQLYGGTAVKKKLLALVLVLVLILSTGNASAFAYAFPGSSTSKSDEVRYFDMTAAEYIDRFNAKYGGMGLTLLADPSHDNCWLAVNGDRTDIRIQFSDKVNGPVTTGSGLDMQEWNWLYAYITTSDYTVDVQYFASLPMLCSQLASVLGCEFTQEEFIDHCTTYGADYPRMQYTKGGVENEIRFRDSSIMDYHQTVYSVSILLVQDVEDNATTASEPQLSPEPVRESVPAPASCTIAAVRLKDIIISSIHTSPYDYVIGLRDDGTVFAVGNNDNGACEIGSWKDIVSIAVLRGSWKDNYPVYAVGLQRNGRVVIAGDREGKFDVSGWTDISTVQSSGKVLLGFKEDGTVVATGGREEDQSRLVAYYVRDDGNTIDRQTYRGVTVILKSDGTVTAEGDNSAGRCNVQGWSNVIKIYALEKRTLGLRADGRVYDTLGELSDWADVVEIYGDRHLYGVKSDGTVLFCPDWTLNDVDKLTDPSDWQDVDPSSVRAYESPAYTRLFGIRKNMTVAGVGYLRGLQNDFSRWTNIRDIYPGSIYDRPTLFGLRNDGTVVVAGPDISNQGEALSAWTEIDRLWKLDDFHKERTLGLRHDGTFVYAGTPSEYWTVEELNAAVRLTSMSSTSESSPSESSIQISIAAAPGTSFNYNILQNEPGYIYDKFDDYWTWYAAYDESYTDANLLIGIQLEGEVGGSDLAGATLYTKIRNKDNRVIDGVQSMAFLVDGVKYSFPEMPGEDCAMAGSVVLYKNGYDLIKAFANAKEVSVKLKLFSGGTVLLDLDRTQFDRTLGNMCRKIIQYKVWEYYIENPGVEMLEMMFPMEVVRK